MLTMRLPVANQPQGSVCNVVSAQDSRVFCVACGGLGGRIVEGLGIGSIALL